MEIYFAEIKLFICQNLNGYKEHETFQLKTNIMQIMNECVRLAVEAGHDVRVVDSARFALFALIDEKLLENRSMAIEWRHATLQETYYGISNAGSQFYSRLQRDIRMKRKSVWIYWWSLLAGFKGAHCQFKIPDQRYRLIDQIYEACCKIES